MFSAKAISAHNYNMAKNPRQLPLFLTNDRKETTENVINIDGNALANKLSPSNRAFHDWYWFVLSYPPPCCE
jgi:hypothetical protein